MFSPPHFVSIGCGCESAAVIEGSVSAGSNAGPTAALCPLVYKSPRHWPLVVDESSLCNVLPNLFTSLNSAFGISEELLQNNRTCMHIFDHWGEELYIFHIIHNNRYNVGKRFICTALCTESSKWKMNNVVKLCNCCYGLLAPTHHYHSYLSTECAPEFYAKCLLNHLDHIPGHAVHLLNNICQKNTQKNLQLLAVQSWDSLVSLGEGRKSSYVCSDTLAFQCSNQIPPEDSDSLHAACLSCFAWK